MGQPEHAAPPWAARLPNVLTGLRVALVPAFALAFRAPGCAPAALGIFLLAAATDWADGALARRLRVTSSFGKFLDPVADKLMVAAALVLLSSAMPDGWVPSLSAVIICRELAVSALREWAALQGGTGAAVEAVAVSNVGKWKTAAQLVAIALLLVGRCGDGVPAAAPAAGTLLLAASAALAVLSASQYVDGFLRRGG